MMNTVTFPTDTFVQITSIEDDNINVSIGPDGYTVTRWELADLMYGRMDDFETFKRNMALALALSGVSVTDDTGIKQVVEGRSFKLFR